MKLFASHFNMLLDLYYSGVLIEFDLEDFAEK
jgi:hypothetical protein